MEITTNLGLTASTPGTSTFNNWFSPEELMCQNLMTAEFIYKETTN
jgi:hypothetical protein